jgi:hypothetical protein
MFSFERIVSGVAYSKIQDGSADHLLYGSFPGLYNIKYFFKYYLISYASDGVF